jgi:hypothetical protein
MVLILTAVPALVGAGKDVNLTHIKFVQPRNTLFRAVHALIEGITID